MFTEEERKFLHVRLLRSSSSARSGSPSSCCRSPSRRRTHEAQVFLTTQISDEAKHVVFFDRFYREVFGIDAERDRRACSTSSAPS